MDEKLGYRARIVEDGAQAVDAVRSDDFAVVLMDCEMPVLDGCEATHAIRALPGDKHAVPIVAMTASAFEGDRERALEAGMNEQ